MAVRFPLKIINAGMYRAGTASLSVALNELGFGPTWHMITNSEDLMTKGTKWWIENDVTSKIYNGEYVNFVRRLWSAILLIMADIDSRDQNHGIIFVLCDIES